jgi:Bax protein
MQAPKPNENTQTKKREFIEKLLPTVQRENSKLRQLHQHLQQVIQGIHSTYGISRQSRHWLQNLARRYQVKGDPVTEKQAQLELLKRVDVIPASLTLAQAATESAWGQSRFALEANNLFGIWTYDKSKGLEPLERDQDKKHLVRKFSDVRESVSYYMHTLNTHPAYRQLREIRYRMRMNNEQPDGHTLASGLEKYSAKGEHYIQLIRDLIRQNQWARLDQAPHTG